ncbi:MAG: DUF1517 domain-containing protein [Cyanobacteria bacterium J06600_6]
MTILFASSKANGYPASKILHSNIEQQSISKNFSIAKKSGGRSGGGSFKRSKPHRSSSPSRSRSSSPSQSIPTTSPSSNYRSSSSSSGEPLGLVGTIVLISVVVFFLSMVLLVSTGTISDDLSDYLPKANIFGDKYERERDNDLVTISLIQVVLSSVIAADIKHDLNQLTIEADTSSNEGLLKLLQDSALLLLRNESAWVYVYSSSNSLNIDRAESAFNSISISERSKFSRETLNHIDGKLKTVESDFTEVSGQAAYLVITLIAGTADDNALFEKIYSAHNLKDALTNIAIVPNDYLMKFELLWTPQQDNEFLTEDELLSEYSNLIFLGD